MLNLIKKIKLIFCIVKIQLLLLFQGEICKRLSVVGTLLAFLNSALNPYLYSFLGSNFTKRWK